MVDTCIPIDQRLFKFHKTVILLVYSRTMRSFILLLAALCAVAFASNTLDGNSHPYVGLAYRQIPSLNGYVTCTGTLVRLPGSGAVAFMTTGQCIAFQDGNGERFRVTFSQSPGISQDAKGFVTNIEVTDSYAGVGYTEYRLSLPTNQANLNVGFITLGSLPADVQIPSLPAQVGAFRESFGSKGIDGSDVDWSSLSVVSYASKQTKSDEVPLSRDRRFCGVDSAQAVRERVLGVVNCYIGDEGAVMHSSEDGLVYGLATFPEFIPRAQSRMSFVRTDSKEFQELLQHVASILSPNRR